MPEYVLNRNYIHRSTMGFTVTFEKGQPVYVPPLIEKEVVAFGAERVDGENPEVLDPEKIEQAPLSDSERKAGVFAAFGKIVARNDSKDFTGQGVPTVKAVEKLVTFDVERFELTEFWAEYKAKDAE